MPCLGSFRNQLVHITIVVLKQIVQMFGVKFSYSCKCKTEQQLFDGIKTGSVTRRDTYNLATYPTTPTIGDQMPNYSQLLTDDQIWDIVKSFKKKP